MASHQDRPEVAGREIARRGYCFDELRIGDRFVTEGRTITEADVLAYAGLAGDFTPIHVDAEHGRRSMFGGRVAPGFLGRVVVSGLVARAGVFHGTALANLGLEQWVFNAPIYLGDTIHAEVTIEGLRPTSDGKRGVVSLATSVRNQAGVTVQNGLHKIMIARCGEVGGEQPPA